MAINPASNVPLLKLILHLQKSLRDARRSAVLVIPLDIVNALLQSSRKAEVASIGTLVNLFDGYNKGNCSRLDAASFHCVVHVFRTARPCRSRDRGLHLFQESLRELTNAIQKAQDQSSILATFHKRKSVLAQKTICGLLETFASADATLPRRWSGEFLLELVRDSADNKLLLSTSSSDTLPQLGKIILKEGDRSLTFVAGAIVREMLDAGYGSSLFWPPDASRAAVARFPSRNVLGSEWVKSFADFLQCLRAAQHAGAPERTRLIQSIEIQGSTPPLPSVTPACMVLLDPITFVTVSEQRLRFVDVPVRSISTIKALGSSIHLQLRHDGYYIANGLSRWSSQVSVGFNDSSQASDTAAVLNEMVAWPLQNRPKQVTFATGHNAGSEEKSCKITRGGSAFLTLAEGEGEEGFGNGGSAQTRLQTHRIRTTGARRKPSYATLELPTGDQVAKESKDALQGHGNSQPAEAITHVRRTPSPAPNAEQLPGNTNPVEQTVPDSETGSNDVLISHGIQDSCGLQVVGSSSEVKGRRGDYKEVDGGLPLLAHEALRLQTSKHPSPPAATGTPGTEPSKSTKYLSSLAAPTVTQQYSNHGADETTVATSSMDANQASNGLDILASENRAQEKGGAVTQTNQTEASGQQPDQNDPPPAAAAAKTSRLRRPLKRPRRLSRRAKSRKRSIDWYQDLRVEGDDEQPAKIDKTNLAPAGQPSDGIRNAKKAKSSSPEKPLPAQVLPLTTQSEAKKAINPPKKMRAKRQVTRTLASTRHARRAATKAKEKLADADDSENVAYDPDDPIESSSPVIPDAQVVQTGNDVSPQAPPHGPEAQTPAGFGDASTESSADPNPLPQTASLTWESTLGHENGVQRLQHTIADPNGKTRNSATAAAGDKPGDCDDRNAKLEETSAGREDPSKAKNETVCSNPKNLKSNIASTGPSSKRVEFTDIKVQGNISTPARDPEPQTISDLSRRVSQFISRQQGRNVQQRETGMETEGTGNADGVFIAPPTNTDITVIHSEAVHNQSQLELTDQEKRTVDQDRGGVNQHVGMMREDGKAMEAEAATCSPRDDTNESTAEREILGKEVFAPPDDTNMGSRPSSPGYSASGSSPSSRSISEASTLIPGCGDNTIIPTRINDSSSLRELTKDEFLSCNPLGEYSSSRASPVADDSPCPKGRGDQNPSAAAAMQGPEQKDRPGRPTTLTKKGKDTNLPEPMGVQTRKRQLKGSDTEEQTIFESNKQRANEGMNEAPPVRGDKARPTRRACASSPKQARAAVRSSFADRLKAGANNSRKQGNSRSRAGKSAAEVRQPPKPSVVTSDSSRDDQEGQPSDLLSKADTETEVCSPSVGYSSEFVSQESSQPAVADSQTAETEWQKTLRDSQRNALDILLDTSHRLIRNMVDEEKAIASVVDVYKRGCSRILDRMTSAHDENLADVKEMQQHVQTELLSRCKTALERMEQADAIVESKTAAEPKKLGLDVERRSRKILRQIENVMQECQLDEGV